MTADLVGLKQRIIAITEDINDADGLASGITIQGVRHLPDSLDGLNLPVMLPLVRPFAYSRGDARAFVTEINWDLYVYIRAVGKGTQAQNEAEPMAILDLFAEAFLTRPQLKFNNSSIPGIVHNAGLELVQGLDEPITYPPKSRQGKPYWGGVFRLSIHKRLIYEINVSGA